VALNPLWYNATLETEMNAGLALANNGFLNIYSGSQPALNGAVTGTLLASLPLSATAFANATATAGTVSAAANTITTENASATGTAAYCTLMASNGTTIIGTYTVGTTGCDLNLNTVSLVSGTPVIVSSFTVSQLQS
jgi:hypothetical protein